MRQPLARALASALASALALGLAPAALADPGYYVVTTYSDKGKQTLDLRYWTVKWPGSAEVVWPEVGFGYGVTDRWFSELFVSNVGPSIGSNRLSSINWQNDYLLTQGESPIDVAIHGQLIHSPGSGQAIEFGPVLQTDVGRTQLNFNLLFDRAINVEPSRPTELKYQWQVRYRLQPTLHLGLQGFGELGPWNHWANWAEQSHRAGPALFGRIDVNDKQAVHWQAAFLRGSIYGSVGHMFTMQLKYVY